MMTNLYIETSAVNYLLDNIFSQPQYSSIKTKELQISKRRKWFISALTLWEIFLTKNESRRFELFDFSRCLFYDNLIPSPEELIVNFIKSRCPRIENRYNLKSNSLFSKEWTKACRDRNYVFQPDRTELDERTKYIRIIADALKETSPKLLPKCLHDFSNIDTIMTNAFLKHIFLEISKQYGNNLNDDLIKFITVTMKVTLILLCYWIGLDQPTIESFWKSIGELEPLERFDYAHKNFPDIFYRGPITNISKMILIQATKFGRGFYFDSLHSSYITYSDLYITNDPHFLNFKNTHINDPNMIKLIDVKTMTIFNK
jgi:hypothetical protein